MDPYGGSVGYASDYQTQTGGGAYAPYTGGGAITGTGPESYGQNQGGTQATPTEVEIDTTKSSPGTVYIPPGAEGGPRGTVIVPSKRSTVSIGLTKDPVAKLYGGGSPKTPNSPNYMQSGGLLTKTPAISAPPGKKPVPISGQSMRTGGSTVPIGVQTNASIAPVPGPSRASPGLTTNPPRASTQTMYRAPAGAVKLTTKVNTVAAFRTTSRPL